MTENQTRYYVCWFAEGPHAGRYVVDFDPDADVHWAECVTTTEELGEARRFRSPEEVRAFWGQEVGRTRPLMRWTISWRMEEELRSDCPHCGAPIEWALEEETGQIKVFEAAPEGRYEIAGEVRPVARNGGAGGYRQHDCG